MMSVNSFAMKNIKSLAAIAVLAGTLGLTSCLDNDDVMEYPAAGYISIYDGAPGNAGVIVYADQNQVNNFPIKYAEVLAYQNFYPGERLFKFSESNSLTSLLEKEYELKVDSVYSMFLLEDLGELNVILIDDDWSEPTADKAQIRMINLSPDAGTVSLKIDEVEDLFFEGLAFKTNSEFESLDTKTYNLTVISTIGETLT
ncbi:MAG: hypothetical protein ACI9UV_003195 [Algoriphagus sp.]|jgi:hypothetical protein